MEQKQFTEKIFSKGLTIILSLVILVMAAVTVVQAISGPVGTKPAPTWVLIAFTLLFFLVTLNFLYLKIVLDEKGIRVSYGIFSSFRKWEDVDSCELDDKNYFYGWGVRFGRYKKQWIWIYNVIGGPRIFFIMKGKKPRGLMVSSKKPEEILRIAGDFIAENKS